MITWTYVGTQIKNLAELIQSKKSTGYAIALGVTSIVLLVIAITYVTMKARNALKREMERAKKDENVELQCNPTLASELPRG